MAHDGDSHGDGHGAEYHPKDALGSGIKAGLITSIAGTFVSTIQNTLHRQNLGAMGFLTKTGSTIATFGAMGGLYQFSRDASANLREKEDTYNSAIGGFMAGSVLGLRTRTLPGVVGYGALLAVALTAFSFTGGALAGIKKFQEEDELERKERIRATRRRPVEETIALLGEGRGVYGADYPQRRAQLLKERYGIEVPAYVPPS